MQFRERTERVRERLPLGDRAIRRWDEQHADRFRPHVADLSEFVFDDVRQVEEHPATGAPCRPRNHVSPRPIARHAEARARRSFVDWLVGKERFDLAADALRDHPVIIDECETAIRAYARSRGGIARQLVQDARWQPLFDRRDAIALKVMSGAVQSCGDDFRHAQRVAGKLPRDGQARRFGIGIDREKSNVRQRFGAESLADHPLHHANREHPGVAETDDQCGQNHAVFFARRRSQPEAVHLRRLHDDRSLQRDRQIMRWSVLERVGVGGLRRHQLRRTEAARCIVRMRRAARRATARRDLRQRRSRTRIAEFREVPRRPEFRDRRSGCGRHRCTWRSRRFVDRRRMTQCANQFRTTRPSLVGLLRQRSRDVRTIRRR